MRDEQAKNQPVFVMALTIFNHSEHGVSMGRVPRELIRLAESYAGSGRVANNLADYVWRTHEFEQSLFKTEHELLATPRRTLLAWFGDHQPPFMSATHIVDRFASQDKTHRAPSEFLSWYDIEANFGELNRRLTPTTIDIAFLPGLIAEKAGIPFDDWLAGNVLARKECGDLFDECRDPNVRNAYLSYMLRDLKSIE
jgi:hypothetical protein